MKPSLRVIVVWLSTAILISSADVANAGPFHDFFTSLRSAIGHPHERSRPHRSSRRSHQHNETPPNDAPTSQTLDRPIPAPPSSLEIRMAKAAWSAHHPKTALLYATPAPGNPDLVISPFAPESGYVDVTGFLPGSEVEDPYTGKIFLTP